MDNAEYNQLLGVYCRHKLEGKANPIPPDGFDGTALVVRNGRPWVRIYWKVLLVVVLLAGLAAGAGAVGVTIKRLLDRAGELRGELDTTHTLLALDQAFIADFEPVQPNISRLTVNVDPVLVESVEVTYDDWETSVKLYDGSRTPGIAALDPSSRTRLPLAYDNPIPVPSQGKRTLTVMARATFIPEVVAAFPEYADPGKTDRTAKFELTPAGIIKLVDVRPEEVLPELLAGAVDLDGWRWEITNSPQASASLANDPSNGAIIQSFSLGQVGDWTNISHAIPGASPSNPAVSLEDLTVIEIELTWSGDRPITLQPKLVDDHGKIVGVMRFIEPGPTSQTLRVPAKLLKGYFGVRSFDFSWVRRLELAVARKSVNQASEGTIYIHRIDLLGTGELPPEPDISRDAMATLATLPLDPNEWSHDQSTKASIELSDGPRPEVSGEGPLLVCEVDLPFDKDRDEEPPWTNLRLKKIQEHNFGGLQAIELELRWDGPAPITIEPMLVTSSSQDTYGAHRRLEPSTEFQKLLVYPHDLKYYWSQGAATDTTRMNLNELMVVSLGIARKAQNQADHGTLYIKAVRLLGTDQ